MSTPPPEQPRKSGGDGKKVTPPPSSIVTRNGARKAKIQTRAMSAGAKPSASLLAAKKKAQQKKKTMIQTELKDPYQVAMDSKSKIKGPTGFVTEPRMAEHRCLWDDNYPECPERLIRIIDRCNELNLIEQCKQYPPRAATKEELSILHSPSVYNMLETTHNNNNLEYLEELSSKYDAIYIHPSTHELALLAAGSTIDMVDRIVSGEVSNGACFVRPPGHHAMRAEPCGYCFYNNVALAARHAIDKRGLNRILIVDWDVHHGQATQQMFYDDPRVLYFSIHRYEHGSFWPNLRHSNFNYVGSGEGRGFTCNVPLNKTGMKDGDYMAIWYQLLLPMAFEYQPELIIISAGYDAAFGCPEGEMELTPAVYGSLLQLLKAVCPSVCVVLEGGYCLPSLAESAAHTLRALLGHAPAYRHEYTEPCDEITETILNCIYVQKRHWSCFKYQPTYNTSGPPNVCDEQKQKHTVVVKWEGDETRPDTFATRDCYPLQDNETKRRIAQRLDHLRIVIDLSLPKHSVGYIYDQAMLKHRNICEPGHPECPERIQRIHERHRDYGLLERVYMLTPRMATDQEILTVHTTEHLHRLKELSTTKLRDLNSQKNSFDSVYFHPDSLESAAMAAGCVIEAVESVVSGVCGSAVCIVRPPGHHADGCEPSGFCLVNSAAVGAVHALTQGGLQRVLLLDWDVHHGNGTQRITYEDSGILYVSLHRYDHGSFFPHSQEADHTAVGGDRARGYNVNIPWNKRGMGDTEYLAAFTQIVLPIALEYNPQLVIISAGFDACVGDPLGGCKVSPECYGRMTTLLRSLAGGRLVLCLEGGYNITSISYAMTMCTKALLGDPILHSYDPKPTVNPSAVETINNVINTLKKYWKSLKFQVALPAEDVLGPPLPSRGLDDAKADSPSTLIDLSVEIRMANMSIDKGDSSVELGVDKKCTDGIHCGTDDEDEIPEKIDSKTKNQDDSDSTENEKEKEDVYNEEVTDFKKDVKKIERRSVSECSNCCNNSCEELKKSDSECSSACTYNCSKDYTNDDPEKSDSGCSSTCTNWCSKIPRNKRGNIKKNKAEPMEIYNNLKQDDSITKLSETDSINEDLERIDSNTSTKKREGSSMSINEDLKQTDSKTKLSKLDSNNENLEKEDSNTSIKKRKDSEMTINETKVELNKTGEDSLVDIKPNLEIKTEKNDSSNTKINQILDRAATNTNIYGNEGHLMLINENIDETRSNIAKSEVDLMKIDKKDEPKTESDKKEEESNTESKALKINTEIENNPDCPCPSCSKHKYNKHGPRRKCLKKYSVYNQGNLNTMENQGNSSYQTSGGSTIETYQEGSNPTTNQDPTTLVDYLASNMQAIVDGEMFAVIPLQWCPHLDTLYVIPPNIQFQQGVKCVECDETVENWVCLQCYITACGRSVNGHMQAHFSSTRHPLVLSLLDLSVWCNVCDAYVDNALLYDAKNNAYRCKFGEDMPWSYNTDTGTIHME